MAIVEINISMSVDGFVTGPNINEHPGLGEGGEILHGWLKEDDPQNVLRENLFGPAGAVITSRKVFDGTGGWGAGSAGRRHPPVPAHRRPGPAREHGGSPVQVRDPSPVPRREVAAAASSTVWGELPGRPRATVLMIGQGQARKAGTMRGGRYLVVLAGVCVLAAGCGTKLAPAGNVAAAAASTAGR